MKNKILLSLGILAVSLAIFIGATGAAWASGAISIPVLEKWSSEQVAKQEAEQEKFDQARTLRFQENYLPQKKGNVAIIDDNTLITDSLLGFDNKLVVTHYTTEDTDSLLFDGPDVGPFRYETEETTLNAVNHHTGEKATIEVDPGAVVYLDIEEVHQEYYFMYYVCYNTDCLEKRYHDWRILFKVFSKEDPQ